MNSRLPPKPDFDSLEAVASQSAAQRTQKLALIGNLIFSWSNNESMFIYILMLLLETDFNSAAIIFVTLNTTRARLDLVRRLAKAKLGDPEAIKKIDRLIDRFNRCTRMRNEFNHCIYDVNERGEITHTNVLRIVESKKEFKLVTVKEFDEKRMKEISNTVKRLKNINRDIWAFLPVLEAAMANRPGRRVGAEG